MLQPTYFFLIRDYFRNYLFGWLYVSRIEILRKLHIRRKCK